ncbi:helix-turn-helix domain-containing protein [Agarilytica rhodophyticola]|uniref:helix-turn-helix domain-containing protein n=1 Tax=Agarilytica rhodophyticola TaxID=1737490 RepID=UPI000B347E3D|nr:helix-turn-helix domain-containing protein [Agarilytica rhodophyticola]
MDFVLDNKNTLIFSTEKIANKEKFDYWVETVCEQLIFVNCERNTKGDFEGILRTNILNDMTFAEMHSVPQTFSRTKGQLSRMNYDSFIVSIPLTFSVNKSIGHRPLPSDKGDISFFDGSREQLLFVQDKIDALIMIIPKSTFMKYLPNPERFSGSLISTRTPAGFLASNYVRSIASQIGDMDTNLTSSIGDHMLQLFSLALNNTVDNAHNFSPAIRHSLFLQLKRYIETNLYDCNLTPQVIADAHRISLRYLYKIFEEEELTVNRFIMSRRLQKTKEALINSKNNHMSITAIALDYGFKDSSHFSRSFKKEFGFTAKEIRKQGVPR